MAIFIASTKSISRSKGQSAVASASYRAGVELKDDRYGKTHNYSKRYGVMSADIILPSSLKDKNISVDRGELWNMAERSEKRKDARVAREWLVNLPHELEEEDRKELAHQFSQELADRYNVIADCAIHQPTQKEIERGADARNFHAHILLTTRQAELTADNKIKLTEKSTAELSDKKRRSLGLERMSHEVKEVRQIWERVANEKLAECDHQLIDSRSYKEQGIDILPQVKMGVDATHLERRTGEKSYKGIINDIIKERNELVFNRELEDVKRINDYADQIIFEGRKQSLQKVNTFNQKLLKTKQEVKEPKQTVKPELQTVKPNKQEVKEQIQPVINTPTPAQEVSNHEQAEQLSAKLARQTSIKRPSDESRRKLPPAGERESHELGQTHSSGVRQANKPNEDKREVTKQQEQHNDQLRYAINRATKAIRATTKNTAIAVENADFTDKVINDAQRSIADTERTIERAERAINQADRAISEHQRQLEAKLSPDELVQKIDASQLDDKTKNDLRVLLSAVETRFSDQSESVQQAKYQQFSEKIEQLDRQQQQEQQQRVSVVRNTDKGLDR